MLKRLHMFMDEDAGRNLLGDHGRLPRPDAAIDPPQPPAALQALRSKVRGLLDMPATSVQLNRAANACGKAAALEMLLL